MGQINTTFCYNPRKRLIMVVAFLTCFSISAGIIRVDFSGEATSGPFDGQTYSGFFTFDTLTVPSDATTTDQNIYGKPKCLEIAANFTLGTMSFDERHSSVYRIQRDSLGNVVRFSYGGDQTGPGGVDSNTHDFAIWGANSVYYSLGYLNAVQSGAPPVWTQSNVGTPVPEPSTILFSALGLGGILLIHKRKSKSLDGCRFR